MMETDPIIQNKAAWLNMPLLLTRQLLFVRLLFGMALYFLRRERLVQGCGGRSKGRSRS